jgi:nucleoside-diphosphate-sugar epimerase
MKKVAIVTGCAGFLGSHLVDRLLDIGYYVIGVDNMFRGTLLNLNSAILTDSFCFIESDLTDTQSIDLIQKEVNNQGRLDYIYHYAAVNGTEHFYDKPLFTFNVNNKTTENILTIARRNKDFLKRLVYTSSSEVYGEPRIIPTPESELISLNINAVRDSYASSKANTEFMVRLQCEESGIPYTILRPFNTYGPRMDGSKYGQVVPEFFRKALSEEDFTIIGSGEETRSFCYVTDHIEMAIKAAESRNTNNEIYNIGAENEITILNLAKIIHDVLGIDFKYRNIESRKDDIQRRCPNIEKLSKAIGLSPKIGIYEGLKIMREDCKNTK